MNNQCNCPLQSLEEVNGAARWLDERGLPRYRQCKFKDWDTALALWHARQLYSLDSEVLDAGGGQDSVFLAGMRMLGYRNLTNINIEESLLRKEDGIRWQCGNITATKLPDNSQNFVMCQSVLEHDVDWRAFYEEMARIIAPGGKLFVSLDYWDRPISTMVKIFDPKEVKEMVAWAEQFGLWTTSPMNYDCRDACVEWSERRYTFMAMLFERRTDQAKKMM